MDLEFIKGQFNEEQLENAIIELFVQQGYTHVFGDSIHRRLEDILLEDDLRAYLEKRYRDDNLTESEIQKIINRLKLIPSEPLYDGNREAFWLVNEGFDLQREDTGKVAVHVGYIDFDVLETTSSRSSISILYRVSACAARYAAVHKRHPCRDFRVQIGRQRGCDNP